MRERLMISRVWLGASLWLLARLWVGYQFLDAGWGKLFGTAQARFVGAHAGAVVRDYLTIAVSAPMTTGAYPPVLAPYAWLITHVFLPAVVPLSYLVAVGETLVGLALMMGFFTRPAAFCGAVLNLAFLLAGSTGLNPYMYTIELCLLLTGSTAGLAGLDYYILPFLKKKWALRHESTGGQAPRVRRQAPRLVR